MGKIFVEDTEISITEKIAKEEGEHVIQDNQYILTSTETRNFKSTIFTYPSGEKILISKVVLFSKKHFKIVLFCDNKKLAWNLIVLPFDHDVRIKRLNETMFFIWTKTQISFCRIKPSTKVEEFTTNFSKLNDVRFEKKFILVSFSDFDEEYPGKLHSSVISYGLDGKRLKTHYED